jgi:hypothetical protein
MAQESLGAAAELESYEEIAFAWTESCPRERDCHGVTPALPTPVSDLGDQSDRAVALAGFSEAA